MTPLYRIGWTALKLLLHLCFRVRVEGAENVPMSGPLIICSNHLSNWDIPAVGCSTRRPLSPMAKEELFRIPLLGWLIRKVGAFPVKRGAGDRAALRTAIGVLKDGKALLLFPEGTRSHTSRLGKGKPGVAFIAAHARTVLVPAGVSSRYRLFGPVTVRFGPPLDLSRYYEAKLDSVDLEHITQEIMDAIGRQLDPEYRGTAAE